jgi:hypothetical protein
MVEALLDAAGQVLANETALRSIVQIELLSNDTSYWDEISEWDEIIHNEHGPPHKDGPVTQRFMSRKAFSKQWQLRLLTSVCLERDQHQATIARMASDAFSIRAPPPVEGPKKSVKLPDPPILTDGKDPKFAEWLSKMKNKLLANADHYSTEPLKMAYIQTRTAGYSADHMAPRLRAMRTNACSGPPCLC